MHSVSYNNDYNSSTNNLASHEKSNKNKRHFFPIFSIIRKLHIIKNKQINRGREKTAKMERKRINKRARDDKFFNAYKRFYKQDF